MGKFGIDEEVKDNIPVAQAYALNESNGNTLWADAISKEMKDMRPTFRKLYNGEIVPI